MKKFLALMMALGLVSVFAATSVAPVQPKAAVEKTLTKKDVVTPKKHTASKAHHTTHASVKASKKTDTKAM